MSLSSRAETRRQCHFQEKEIREGHGLVLFFLVSRERRSIGLGRRRRKREILSGQCWGRQGQSFSSIWSFHTAYPVSFGLSAIFSACLRPHRRPENELPPPPYLGFHTDLLLLLPLPVKLQFSTTVVSLKFRGSYSCLI